MESFLVDPTDNSPMIEFNPEKNIFSIEGVSRPEDVNAFYKPVLEWLEEYIKTPNPETIVQFKFKYFNTSSLKSILVLLSLFKKIDSEEKKVLVKWFYDEEDDAMHEAGSLMEEISGLSFEFVIVK